MNFEELHQELFRITSSEDYHVKFPNAISKRYQAIPKFIKDGQLLYRFSFDSLLKNQSICIMKESRFAAIPLHTHKVIELNYVYHGSCTQIINGHQVILQKGDVCILDTNTPHEILKTQEDDILITIDMRKSYFTNGFLSRLTSQGIVSEFLANAITENTDIKQYITFRSEEDEKLHSLIQQLLCEYFDEERSLEVIDAYMSIIFAQLLRIYKRNSLSQHAVNKNTILITILQYLETNYQTVSLKSAADHFNFNPTYLGNYIKKKTGRTFKELIIRQKLTQACFYLTNTELPIYEIAREIGYENLGFFYKKFYSAYGCHPQEFRDHTKK